MSFYRGYIRSKGKVSLEKFKGVDNLKSYDEVKDEDSFNAILDGESILLDFDDSDNAKCALKIVQEEQLKCRVYKTTRGVHILFKNKTVKKCGTGVGLACGLICDIKVGKNSYQNLKLHGVEREIIYDSGEYSEVPKFFIPSKGSADFLNMSEGDGRNQSLFNYILSLQSQGFAKAETRHVLKIVNNYVLRNPLSERELEVIMRDDAFAKPCFFEEKTFLFDKFAEYLKNNAGIVKIDGELHMYRDGIYVSGEEEFEAEMIKHIPTLNKTKRTEVLNYLKLIVRDNTEQAPANYIAFKNGVYDIIKDELLPFSNKFIIINRIDYNYNPKAYSELVDKTLDKMTCNDKEIRALLEEGIGYCFYRRNELGKSFVLVGDGSSERGASNGKSTFLHMVKTLLGKRNISALDLSELTHEFKPSGLFGKLANIGDDIDDAYIGNSSVFKKLVTGEMINANRKYLGSIEFESYAKLWFSANEIPKIKDRGGAVQRRLIIVPFLAHFSKTDPDYRPYIKYELVEPECMEYLIQLGIAGLKRVLVDNCFTQSAKIQKQLDDFEENNNPVVAFFNEHDELEVENQTTDSIFQMYQSFCLSNNYVALSKREFNKQVGRIFNVETKPCKVDGKTQRVFVSR